MTGELTVKTESSKLINWADPDFLEDIKRLFAPKLTSAEFQMYCGMAKSTGLNPFLKEIWAVKYQDNQPAQIFVGRDGYRKSAQSHPDYDYHQCDAVYENDEFSIKAGEVHHTYTLKNRGRIVGAYCITKRKSSSKPIFVYAEFKEYSTGRSLWNEQNGKPATMIKKVAEAQCLRMCFQELFGGTYTEEEMEKVPEKIVQVETVQTTDATELKKVMDEELVNYEKDSEVLKKIYVTLRDANVNPNSLRTLVRMHFEKKLKKKGI